MPLPATHAHARRSLRQLTSPQTLDFCRRLLSRSKEGSLTFREFLTTARELVRERPEDSAMFLAALVALDMASDDAEHAICSHQPCHN